jgi:hypothetical protein
VSERQDMGASAEADRAAHIDCECAECRPYAGLTREQLQEGIAENERRLAGKGRGVWYPSSIAAPLGCELLATDGEAVQASIQYSDGQWRSVGRQSYLWSSPTAWMLPPDPPPHCDGCDQMIPWHSNSCPSLAKSPADQSERTGA